jgi:hypothetical protein
MKETALFLDCEFNGFGGELISMALVCRDGREWYEVLPCESPCEWVAEHVMPILNKDPITQSEFAASLCRFLSQWESVHIVADWPEDIAHFCRALITGPGTRIATPHLSFQIFNVESTSEQPHNALADARGIDQALRHLS